MPPLRELARAFVDLQEDRHTADYDNHEQWSPTEVQATLNTARSAFQRWQSIRTDPMAGNYLLAMLLNKQRPLNSWDSLWALQRRYRFSAVSCIYRRTSGGACSGPGQ